jgi:uncharacterized protein YdhG (YjbR/CyaY superfamily)
MQSSASTPDEYISELPSERKEIIIKLRSVISKNLPKGFEEKMSYGMLGYVVPHSIYPQGYHCNTKLPLPFINLASQKNFIALYHMKIYLDMNLLNWFTEEFKKTGWKPDIGKSCIRFKNMEKIPFDLIGELCKKVTVQEWIDYYNDKIHN